MFALVSVYVYGLFFFYHRPHMYLLMAPNVFITCHRYICFRSYVYQFYLFQATCARPTSKTALATAGGLTSGRVPTLNHIPSAGRRGYERKKFQRCLDENSYGNCTFSCAVHWCLLVWKSLYFSKHCRNLPTWKFDARRIRSYFLSMKLNIMELSESLQNFYNK